MILKKGTGWGYRLIVVLPCGDEHEIPPSWIASDGAFIGTLQCTSQKCRKQYEGVKLEGWAQ